MIDPAAPLALVSKWPHCHLSFSSLPVALSLLFSFLQPLTLSLSDLQRYFQGLGPQPKFQVTLNFLEEDPSPNHTPQNLISVQVSSGQGKKSCLALTGVAQLVGRHTAR